MTFHTYYDAGKQIKAFRWIYHFIAVIHKRNACKMLT